MTSMMYIREQCPENGPILRSEISVPNTDHALVDGYHKRPQPATDLGEDHMVLTHTIHKTKNWGQ